MFAKSIVDAEGYGLHSSLRKSRVWGLCAVVGADGTATIFTVTWEAFRASKIEWWAKFLKSQTILYGIEAFEDNFAPSLTALNQCVNLFEIGCIDR